MGKEDGGPAPAAVASIRFHLPAPPLRAFITSYYLVDSPGPLSECLHPEWGNIRFSLRGTWELQNLTGPDRPTPASSLFGPTDRTRRFGTQDGFMLGIGLTPIGWLKIVRRDAGPLAKDYIELDAMFGPTGDELARRLAACVDDAARCVLLDDLFTTLADGAHPDEAGTMDVHRALIEGSAESIDDVIAATGLSHRTLNRLCLRVFGFGPKRLLRRQRFLRTLGRIRDQLDQPIAAMIGDDYYDQAHFIREFRAFMGMTPTAYFTSPREVMRRVAVERTRVVGAPVQVLHGALV